MNNKLIKAFDKARKASENRGFILGVLGKTSTDTPADIIVPNRTSFLYVRVTSGSNLGVTIARNNGIAIRANTPVKMVMEGSNLSIVGVDLSNSYYEAATGGVVLSTTAGGNLDDLSNVDTTGKQDGDIVYWNGSMWVDGSLRELTIYNTPPTLVTSFIEYPQFDPTQVSLTTSRLDENTVNPSYPTSWIEDIATGITRVSSPYGFWSLSLTDSYQEYQYTKGTGIILNGLGSSSNRFIIGPVYVREGLYTNDVDSTLAIHADNSGVADDTVYVGLRIHYELADLKWTVKGVSNDGSGEILGTALELYRFGQGFYVIIELINDGSQTFTVYVGSVPLIDTSMPVYGGSNGVTWGATYLRIHGVRGTNADAHAVNLMLGGFDYQVVS